MNKLVILIILTFSFLGCSEKDLSPIFAKWILKSVDTAAGSSQVSFEFDGLPNEKEWSIYFNHQLGLLDRATLPKSINMEHLAGDFFKLSLAENFTAEKQSLSFDYKLNVAIQRSSDAPSGLYLVTSDNSIMPIDQYQVIGIDESTLSDFPLPNSSTRFTKNEKLTEIDPEMVRPIVPQPSKLVKLNGMYSLKSSATLNAGQGLQNETKILIQHLESINVNATKANNDQADIQLSLGHDGPPESYQLTIGKDGIIIKGTDAAGVFYGIQSLMGLVNPAYFASKHNEINLNFVEISDEPRFGYRGVHMDVARNFHPKQTVLKVLELMSQYKLNKYHFHITDDEGWRIEIPGLPELTEVGSKRGHTIDERKNMYPYYGSGPHTDGAPGSGYYSREDFIEILQYARDRHIEVIPEIDIPSHARAAITSMSARYLNYMDQGKEEEARKYLLHDFDDKSEYSSAQNFTDNIVCVCQESTYRFVEKVIDEVVIIFEEADVPLYTIHSGGDELPFGPWQKSPVCEKFISDNPAIQDFTDLHAYFMKRFKAILDKRNLQTAGWEEIVLEHSEDAHEGIVLNESLIGQNYRPYVWNAVWGWGREDMAYKLANAGYPIVFCNSAMLYMDMAYNRDPNETGLSWSGWTETKTCFDVIPLDIFANAKYDKVGNLLKQEDIDNKVRLTEAGKQNFLGIQGQLWCETIKDQEKLEYMMFPKLLAIAERAWASEPAWSNGDADKQAEDWNQFANTLGQRELPKLNYKEGGINYRIPLPGAMIQDKLLHANTTFPGLDIRYTIDGTEPVKTSALYKKPIQVLGDVVKLKAFDSKGRSSRTSIID